MRGSNPYEMALINMAESFQGRARSPEHDGEIRFKIGPVVIGENALKDDHLRVLTTIKGK